MNSQDKIRFFFEELAFTEGNIHICFNMLYFMQTIISAKWWIFSGKSRQKTILLWRKCSKWKR